MQLKNAIFKKESVVILLLLMCSGSIGYYINSYINKKWYNQDMLTANQIASFITYLRSVSTSNEARIDNQDKIKLMSTSLIFNEQLKPMMVEESKEFNSMGKIIKITNILPIDKNNWRVTWREYKNETPYAEYQAMIKFGYDKEYNKSALPVYGGILWNPTGLVVNQLHLEAHSGLFPEDNKEPI